MQTELSVEIDRPIAEVFDYTINHVAEWSEIVVEDDVIDEKPEGVGTTFRVVTDEKGRRMEFQGVVTRHEPPTASTVLMKGQYFDIEAEYSFEDLSGRTRVTQRSTVTGKGFFKLILFLGGVFMKSSGTKSQNADFALLKRLLEARESPAAS